MRNIAILILLHVLVAVNCNLELVHVFFRHGSRTPDKKDIYPNDPYDLKDFQPMGWGQLTNIGKQRSYDLGKLLRKRYQSFLGDDYSPEIVSGISTDYDRTKMTILLVLAGLFPPSISQKWNQEFPWNPIPYHYDKAKYDYFLRRPLLYCPTYSDEVKKMLESDLGKSVINDNKQVMDYIALHTGKPIRTVLDVFKIYQTLNAEASMNLTLPKWTEKVYPGVIHDMAAKQCQLENFGTALRRLNGGRSLQKILENVKEKMQGSKPDVKIYLYSGHENNVLNVLAALGMFEPHVPKYCAAVIIELHKIKENGYGIKISDVSSAFYDCNWVDLPVRARKILPFCIMRAQKEFTIKAGGMLEINNNAFIKVVKAAFSFLTLMRSLKE